MKIIIILNQISIILADILKYIKNTFTIIKIIKKENCKEKYINYVYKYIMYKEIY